MPHQNNKTPPLPIDPEEEGQKKYTFQIIFALLALMLLVMPFVSTFSDLITRLLQKIEFYTFLQNFVVPWEIRMIIVILNIFGLEAEAFTDSLRIVSGGRALSIYIAWNCIGWQSFILMLITLITGLRGRFSWGSKIDTILFGLIGTFLINLIRLSLVVFVAYHVSSLTAVIFHDYFSNFLIIIWLFFFWWFAYTYLLREKKAVDKK